MLTPDKNKMSIDLEAMLDLDSAWSSFERMLRAANRSPETVRTYGQSVRYFRAFLVDRGMPTNYTNITREHVEAFLQHLLETRSSATAATRHGGLRSLFRYLVDEGELTRSPMERIPAPQIEQRRPPVIPQDAQRKLLAACRDSKRDTAIVRLMIATPMRRAELMNLKLQDFDFDDRILFVLGKGKRERAMPYGAKAAVALDRYRRERARSQGASLPWLWLTDRGRFAESGLNRMLNRRAEEAGLLHLHPHMFRHSFAHYWLKAMGNEGDLMRLSGWTSRRMLDRYTDSAGELLARDAYRRLAPGDDI